MATRNPQIVEEILKADAEKKMSLIRENAEKLTVSDLNEISIRLIKNLTDSINTMETETDQVAAQTHLARAASGQKQAERRSLLKQIESDEIETQINTTKSSKPVLKAPKEQLEIDNYDDILDDELEIIEDSKNEVNPLVVAAVGFVLSAVAFGISYFLGLGVFSSIAPLAVWIMFAGLGITGRPVKTALVSSSVVSLGANYVSIMGMVSAITQGTFSTSSQLPSLILAAISFMAVVMSVLWTSKE